MTVKNLNIADPFFTIKIIKNENSFFIKEKAIILNLSQNEFKIRSQILYPLRSIIVNNLLLEKIDHIVLIEKFDKYENEDELMANIKKAWPSAYDIRKEDRLKGISHFMSPKQWDGRFGYTVYHSGSVPLNVGLHKDHPFCPDPGFREIHTQIVGYGKMQQFQEKNLNSLYAEELMCPGNTHMPMYDENFVYPWHQYETVTPSVFLAVEILPT